MGTDIYLTWDGQTKQEKDAQITGYSINAGNAGYLRASIGMQTENSALGEVFPTKTYWLGEDEKLKPDKEGFIAYDFKVGWAVLQVVAKKYLATVLFGIPYKKNDIQIEKETWFKRVSEMLTAKGKFDKVEISTLEEDLPSAIMWLNSLYGFFYLGLEKQKKGLNPKVMISW